MSGVYRRKEFASIHLNAKGNGFSKVPENLWTKEIKEAVNLLFKGKAVVCTNPQGSLSIFSESEFLQELAKG